jgi:ABC-2 type transport system permease protein
VSAAAEVQLAPVGRMLMKQTWYRLLGRLRNPAFTVLSLGLPVMFFALFNAIFGSRPAAPGVSVSKYIMVSYATYAVGNVMVYNFGIGIANDRDRKVDVLQRAMPLPSWVAVGSQVIYSLVFTLIGLLILFAYASLIGGVHMSAATWLDLVWRLLLGSFPMIAIGMAIGYGASANAAPALANVIYLPMLFVSGIFISLNLLPDTVRTIGSLLPTYHYAQLCWAVLGTNDESPLVAIAWLAGWTIVLTLIALRLYRLDQDKKFS